MGDLIRQSDSVILARHGSVTVGVTMDEAFKKLEKLEHNAEILIWAHLLGGPTAFSDNQLADLNNLRSFYGVTSKSMSCSIAPSPRVGSTKQEPAQPPYKEVEAPTYRSNNDLDALVSEIVARVKKQL
jgi:L-fuculose-phosphate aldolase